jgi:hypothetical protein
MTITPQSFYGSGENGDVCHFPKMYGTQLFPGGYYVFNGTRWVSMSRYPLAERIARDKRFREYPVCKFVLLPDNTEISRDGTTARQLSGDFCGFVRLYKGWLSDWETTQRRREGYAPGMGIWLPLPDSRHNREAA